MPLIDQPTAAPALKVNAAGIGAVAGTLGTFALRLILLAAFPDNESIQDLANDPDVMVGLSGAIASISAWVAGYYKKERA